MPLADQRAQFPILGRVALGYLTTNAAGKTYPARSETLVFTADDEELLRQVAQRLGGRVESAPVQDESSEPRWRVITDGQQLHVRMPTADDRSFSQWYERWGRGGILRRCDGVTCQFAVLEPGQSPQRDVPCPCREEHLPAEDRCDPTTRLNVVIEELFGVTRMGLWQVTSRGWDSTREMAAAVELLRAGGVVAGVPLLLRVEKRTRRARDGKSYDFPAFTLTPLVSFAEAAQLAQQPHTGLFSSTALALPSGDSPTDRTGVVDDVLGATPSLESSEVLAAPGPPYQDALTRLDSETGRMVRDEETEQLRAACQEFITQLGISPDRLDRIWKAVRPEGDATLPMTMRLRYRRLLNVLNRISVGESETAAVQTALEQDAVGARAR